MTDPRTKYPKPPFAKQSQPWPGLASKMDPVPDHGEKSYRGSGRLAGRKALITGGDSGMGRAAAIAYAREGCDVAINYFPTEEPDAAEVIALIKAEKRVGLALPGDLRDEAFCRDLVARAVSGLGGLDIVVNNAGRQQTQASILDITSEAFDATMKTNIYAPFWIIKAALPHLKPGSVLIATTSEQAYDPSAELYDYAQTKAANMSSVKSLAKQLAPRGIRVNGVAPGPIWTPLQVSGGATMEKLEQFGGQTPLGRPGRTGLDLCSARRRGRQLHDGPHLRRCRRQRTALASRRKGATKPRRSRLRQHDAPDRRDVLACNHRYQRPGHRRAAGSVLRDAQARLSMSDPIPPLERGSFARDGLHFSYLERRPEAPKGVLLILHAHWMGASDFADVIPWLPAAWHVLALDQRGHGETSHGGVHSVAAYCSDIDALLEACDVHEPIVILGHSFGGMVANLYAARQPERVRGLILEDIEVARDDRDTFILPWAGRFPSREALEAKIGKRLAPYLAKSIVQDDDGRDGDGWRLTFEPTEVLASERALNGDHWAEWMSHTCPALVIRGARSVPVDGKVLAEMARHRPNTEFAEIDAGHSVHIDAPQPFIETVKRFLARLV